MSGKVSVRSFPNILPQYDSYKNNGLEYRLYLAGIVFAVISIIGILFLIISPFKLTQVVPACAFKSVTGLYCPGCGGTRAAAAFVSGHWLKSLLYHPFVPYCGVLYILYMAKGTIAFVTKGKYNFMEFKFGYVYIGVAVLLTQFVIKDVLLIGYGIDLFFL